MKHYRHHTSFFLPDSLLLLFFYHHQQTTLGVAPVALIRETGSTSLRNHHGINLSFLGGDEWEGGGVVRGGGGAEVT